MLVVFKKQRLNTCQEWKEGQSVTVYGSGQSAQWRMYVRILIDLEALVFEKRS